MKRNLFPALNTRRRGKSANDGNGAKHEIIEHGRFCLE